MPAGLGTLFVGLLLIVLAFVEGDSVWKSAHQILFGLFGCGSFVLGAAVCYLAILYTRGQDLLMQVFKLLLGLIFASGTVIVFSDIPADLTAAQMIAACYQNGANAWLGGGVLGTLLGGNLLLLCGRPAPACTFLTLRPPSAGSGSATWAAASTKRALPSTSRMPPAGLSVWQNAPLRRPRQRNMRTMATTCRKTKWAGTAAAAKSLPRPPSISSLPAGWLASSTGAIR